ncbi:MAG: DUF3160 domain-containing protein [Polyangiaceae bacterium]|nr:DUF3160 domain-containing protein [Polyangiaceae bacterium]
MAIRRHFAAIVVLCALGFGGCSHTMLARSTNASNARVVPREAPPPSADVGPPLSQDEICTRAPIAHAASLPGKKPFTDLDPQCGNEDEDHFCNAVAKTPDPQAACYVTNDDIARAERESQMQRGMAASTSAEWDGTTSPKYLERIDAHLHLTPEEHDKLRNNHFVVLDRLAFTDYASAFHTIFQEQLPLFVGVDPILHAVYRGTEFALEYVEQERLVPALASLLKKLRASLVASAATMDAETRADLDIYLGVAATLADSKFNDSRESQSSLSSLKNPASDATIRALRKKATANRELETVALFGRERMIDFSQFEPRGHYTDDSEHEPLSNYFMAMMWLSRLELNLVSRSSRSSSVQIDPSETPREVKDALALSELIERSGASTELRAFDEIYSTFAGRREDVSPAKLRALAKANGIRATDASAAPKLKTAIGEGFKRTARTHFTPENAPDLPVIFTMMGPRIVPDVAPLTRVVHDEVPERKWPTAADVGYILGHDRARAFIDDFEDFPGLPDKFKAARKELQKNAAASKDIYGLWLQSVLALGARPQGVVPSFMKTEAYADHRLNSALVGYGQIRHTFVLLAAQAYGMVGCEIPDAYVEPLPAVFDGLLNQVRTMKAQARGWNGLERVLAMLAGIAHNETSGRILSEPERRWLAMVSENIPMDGFATGQPPRYTGWYFDMFEDRERGATKATSFIADYLTLTDVERVLYLGAEGPRLAVFIVDAGGEPRAMVGPVAKGFEANAPIAGRLSDDKVFGDGTTKTARWRTSYAVAPRAEPALGLEGQIVSCYEEPRAPDGPDGPVEWRIAIRSTRASAGPTTITLLDHHADPLTAKLTIDVDREWKIAVFDMPPELARSRLDVEAFHLRIEDLARSRTGTGSYDYTSSPSVFVRGYHSDDSDDDSSHDSVEERMPTLPHGMGAFAIGVLPSSGSKDAGP